MDELRFVRRDDRSLILANEADEEFTLIVDEAVLAELKHLSRRESAPGKVRPREIQALIRAGKSLSQVASATGLEEIDIERYAEPVLAERRYILERAQAVAVRTDANEDAQEQFGEVIVARLESLGADTHEWTSWKDEVTGWRIALEFIARDVAHRAEWAFEHRTGVLAPENSDAVNLSKQGDVGDRLIPKLRAVDDREQRGRFDSGAFDTSDLSEDAEQAAGSLTESDAQSAADTEAEYERRREIDQRAIKSSDDSPADLSQTADLLDALRKRRGERDQRGAAAETGSAQVPSAPGGVPSDAKSPEAGARDTGLRLPEPPAPQDRDGNSGAQGASDREQPSRVRSIWGGNGVSSDAPAPLTGAADNAQATPSDPFAPRPVEPASQEPEKTGKKGRASIPSWDDILFGTRSDEDPAD